MRFFILAVVCGVLLCAAGIAVTYDDEVDEVQRCAAEGGVLVESGLSFDDALCIDESAVIW